MASIACCSSKSYSCVCIVFILAFAVQSCYGFGKFGFEIHHRFSDKVKGILAVDDLPAKGSLQYYAVMAKRDRFIHGRNLAVAQDQTPLTFSSGNETYLFNSLGYLHYANINVGTPSVSFLVALDTGSDLFWLPCNCSSCVLGLKTSDGEIPLNIYSPSNSSTSSQVPCNSTLCGQQRQCSLTSDGCPYQIRYLSNGTSSTGTLVEDVLHLTTDSNKSEAVDARITFGCGKVQTGTLLEGSAPNGLFGLGVGDISVPSILAKEGLTSNSFSLCFGADGVGRISFGDKGSSEQGETPFNLGQLHYDINITQVRVGGNVSDFGFSATFDSGTSFTYLNDPAYTFMTERFDSVAKDARHPSDPDVPFEYCYDLSPNQTTYTHARVNLTMQGGYPFYVTDPTVVLAVKTGYVYCLGILKSDTINIIGQNFMTGYRIVFDKERMVLGWKPSNCYNVDKSTTLPISPPISPATAPAITPAAAVNPEATSGSGNGSTTGTPSPVSNNSPQLISCTRALILVLFALFVTV